MRGGGGYRDPLAALRNRIAEKRAALGPAERFLTLVRRAVLPRELVYEVATLGRITENQKASTLEELTEIDRALDQLAEKYDQSRALLAPARGPFGPPDAPLPRADQSGFPNLLDDVSAIGEGLDGRAEPWGAAGALLRFSSQGAAMIFAAHPLDRYEETVFGLVRAPVPSALPPLVVRLERFSDSVLSAIHVRREVELRIRSFDETFWIEGEELSARALLVPEVRDAMRGLAKRDPVLKVWDGIADLEWIAPRRWALSVEHPRAAMDGIVSVLATI